MALVINTFEIGAVKPYKPKNLPEHAGTKVVSEELIGIEVEIENTAHVSNTKLNPCWTTHADGSLRNAGVEYITKPIPAGYAPGALTNLLTEVLDRQCSFSPRTSIHVHLNVQDLDVTQVADIVMLYTIYEKLLYRYAGRGRMKNIYCVPIAETTFLDAMTERNLGSGWSDNYGKYTGLNLAVLSRYGTLEFRHMHGTFNVEKLAVWLNFITGFKAYVKAHPTGEIRKMIYGMDDDFDFRGLARELFGESAGALDFRDISDVRENYLAAKLTGTTSKAASRVQAAASRQSPYFQGT